VEPVGQDMDQKAADELVGVERHELVASVELGPVILPFESHVRAVEGDEPAIGNSDCSAAIWMRPATVTMGIWHRGNGMIVAA
jgi:hypothetical protein